jgi:hypothetical protein
MTIHRISSTHLLYPVSVTITVIEGIGFMVYLSVIIMITDMAAKANHRRANACKSSRGSSKLQLP